jgi:glycosyltransferase involved in cell wall biosynthesis
VNMSSVSIDSRRKSGVATAFGVLLVGNFLSTSRPGSYSVCELLAQRLESNDWPVTTVSHKSGRLSRLLDMLTTVWRCRREYSAAQVDVYSGPSFVWAECVCGILAQLRKPFILTLHGGNLPAFGRRWPVRVRRLLRSAAFVTTPSRYVLDGLRPYRDDLVLLPNAIDLEAYAFRLRSKPEPSLVWLRALHQIYNPEMAVRVIAELFREFPAIRLSIFGPDKGDGTARQLTAAVRTLGVERRVSLVGPVRKDQVSAALNSGDVFLNTTNYESFGVAVMEAAACGLCIVSTDAGELPSLWSEGEEALLVHRNDSKAMASAVRNILRNSEVGERLSRNARAKAAQYDWSVILPRWEQLLIDVGSMGGARIGAVKD